MLITPNKIPSQQHLDWCLAKQLGTVARSTQKTEPSHTPLPIPRNGKRLALTLGFKAFDFDSVSFSGQHFQLVVDEVMSPLKSLQLK